MYRPEGFKNPYCKAQVERIDEATLRCQMKDGTCMEELYREAREHTWEAGARCLQGRFTKAGRSV